MSQFFYHIVIILLTKTTAARNEDALSCLRVRGPYYLAVVFVATIYIVSGLYFLAVIFMQRELFY